MTGFTDLHNHCMWGMDDGAKTFSETCRMLKLAAEAGTVTLAATPHVTPGRHPFPLETYHQRLAQMRRWAEDEGLMLTILEGTEVWYTDRALPMLRDGLIPTLGGTPCVLMEFSPDVQWREFQRAAEAIFRGGYVPVIAHIERYRGLYGHAEDLKRLHQDIDVAYQVNAAAVVQPRGLFQHMFLKRMLHQGNIDLIATDAHDDRERAHDLRAAFTRLKRRYGEQCARTLTGFQPEAFPERLYNR